MIKNLMRDGFRNDFTITERGLSFIYFQDPAAEACKQFDNIFYRLSNDFPEINFFVVKMTQEIWTLGKNNDITIKLTPALILFVNGIVRSTYNGPLNLQKLSEFLRQLKRENFVERVDFQPQPQQPNFIFPSNLPPHMISSSRRQNDIIYNDESHVLQENSGQLIPINQPWKADDKRMAGKFKY